MQCSQRTFKLHVYTALFPGAVSMEKVEIKKGTKFLAILPFVIFTFHRFETSISTIYCYAGLSASSQRLQSKYSEQNKYRPSKIHLHRPASEQCGFKITFY